MYPNKQNDHLLQREFDIKIIRLFMQLKYNRKDNNNKSHIVANDQQLNRRRIDNGAAINLG